MTFGGLAGMFDGYSADMRAGKFSPHVNRGPI